MSYLIHILLIKTTLLATSSLIVTSALTSNILPIHDGLEIQAVMNPMPFVNMLGAS